MLGGKRTYICICCTRVRTELQGARARTGEQFPVHKTIYHSIRAAFGCLTSPTDICTALPFLEAIIDPLIDKCHRELERVAVDISKRR